MPATPNPPTPEPSPFAQAVHEHLVVPLTAKVKALVCDVCHKALSDHDTTAFTECALKSYFERHLSNLKNLLGVSTP